MRSKHIFWLALGCWCLLSVSPTAAASSAYKRPFQKSTMRPKKTPSPARKNSFGVMDTSTAAARDKAEKRRNLALEREVQRAWMYSAIVPGWGQARNQQHSRVLGIYLVFGVLAGGDTTIMRSTAVLSTSIYRKRDTTIV